VVIGTELEPSKATMARKHWDEAGSQISELIQLREGDLRETLAKDLPQIDLPLLDSESAPDPRQSAQPQWCSL
jgi:predicted O-methyltransferase YrrM